jgi:hypothetical protein
MNRSAFIFTVSQSEESAEGNSWYSSWKVWARRLKLWREFLYYNELRHAHMPTVVITSVGQVIVCSSNLYTPFLYKRLPSGCVSFVGEWEHRRPSYVIHVSFEQHETKRCPTGFIVKGNIVLIPFLLYWQDFGFLLGGTWCDPRLYLRPSWLPLRISLRRLGQNDRTGDILPIPPLNCSLTIRDHFPVFSDVMQLP